MPLITKIRIGTTRLREEGIQDVTEPLKKAEFLKGPDLLVARESAELAEWKVLYFFSFLSFFSSFVFPINFLQIAIFLLVSVIFSHMIYYIHCTYYIFFYILHCFLTGHTKTRCPERAMDK